MSSRLQSAEAVAAAFTTVLDLIPADEGGGIAIRAVPDDERLPLTFERLQRFVSQFDVSRFGLVQGSRLCSSIPNGPEAAVLFLAGARYCTYAPLNQQLTASEVAFEFEDLPASACIVQRGEDNTTVLELCASKGVVALELTPSNDHVGEFSLTALLPTAAVPPGLVTRGDVCLVLHTSGTTAKPKIVPLHHENVAVGAQMIASCLQLNGQRSTNLNVMPLYHIHAISINLLASLVSGAATVAAPGPQPDRFLNAWLQASPSPTWYSAVPTIHQLFVRQAEAMGLARLGGHSLTFVRSESSMLPRPVGEAIEELFGVHVAQTYAMTESMPIAANPLGAARKLTSVGFSAGPELRICDDEGREAKTGSEGEVCVPRDHAAPASHCVRCTRVFTNSLVACAPQVCVRGAEVTAGYEKRAHMAADPNLAAFHSDAALGVVPPESLHTWVACRGWLRTGDKGYLDADGHLQLVGRFKEIINRGGEKISPVEIEHVLRRHPAIADMLVFAAPHAQLGEVVGVAAVPRFPCTLDLAALRAFGADEGLATKWLPEALVWIDVIPKGATGKPARIGLAARLGIAEIDASGSHSRVEAAAAHAGGTGEDGVPAAYDSLALPGTKATRTTHPLDFTVGLRFVLILWIVLFHATPDKRQEHPQIWFFDAVALRLMSNVPIAVNGFIALSGFTMAWSQRGPVGGGSTLAFWYMTRLDRILVSTWFWMAMSELIVGAPGMLDWGQRVLCYLQLMPFVSPSWTSVYNGAPALANCPDAPTWFIGNLLPQFLLFPLVTQPVLAASSRAGDTGRAVLLLAAGAMLICPYIGAILWAIFVGKTAESMTRILTWLYYFPLANTMVVFFWGAAVATLAHHQIERRQLLPRNCLIPCAPFTKQCSDTVFASVLADSCALAIVVFSFINWDSVCLALRLPLSGLAFSGLLYGAVLGASLAPSKVPTANLSAAMRAGGFVAWRLSRPACAALGVHSLEVYLLHEPMLYAEARLPPANLPNASGIGSHVELPFSSAVYVALCWAIAIIFATYVQNPFISWLRALVRGCIDRADNTPIHHAGKATEQRQAKEPPSETTPLRPPV